MAASSEIRIKAWWRDTVDEFKGRTDCLILPSRFSPSRSSTLAAPRFETVEGRGAAGCGRRPERVAAEGVAESVDGAYEPGFAGLVPEGGSDLGHEVCEVRGCDEGGGPEGLAQLRLRHDLWSMGEEHREQLQSLWRQMQRLCPAQQLPAPEVQDEFSKGDPHAVPCLCRLCATPGGESPAL